MTLPRTNSTILVLTGQYIFEQQNFIENICTTLLFKIMMDVIKLFAFPTAIEQIILSTKLLSTNFFEHSLIQSGF